MHVVVAGQGYVGLPLAVRAAEVGHRVFGHHVDLHRIKQLTAGESSVEDVTSSRLRAVLDSGAYSVTADAAALAGFDIEVITVPTPLRAGVPELTYIESCARTLGEHLRPGATVVLESTTYPGTTEELLLPVRVVRRLPGAGSSPLLLAQRRGGPARASRRRMDTKSGRRNRCRRFPSCAQPATGVP